MAEDFIVEHGNMTELTGKTRLTVIQLAIYHDSHANAVVEVDKQHILLILYPAAAKFAVGHRPGIVFQVSMYTKGRLDDPAEWIFVKIKKAITVAGGVIDAPTEIDADSENFFPLHRTGLNELINNGT